MSKQKRVLWVVIILIVYVVIAIIGFFIVYLIRNATHKQPQSTTTAVTTPAVTTAPITPPTNWKTYSNPKADLSLKYPSDLKEKSSSYGFGVSSVEMRSPDNTDSANAPDYQLLIVPKKIASTIGQDFDTYYAMPNNTTKVISSPLSQDKSKQQFTKLQNRTIQGHRAFDYRSLAADATASEEAEIGTFIENGDNLILISTGESNKAELEQVIGTLDLLK